MPASFELDEGNRYKVDDWEVKPSKPSGKAMAAIMNKQRPPAGPSGADPNPDLTLAQYFVDLFGGKILAYTRIKGVKNRVY